MPEPASPALPVWLGAAPDGGGLRAAGWGGSRRTQGSGSVRGSCAEGVLCCAWCHFSVTLGQALLVQKTPLSFLNKGSLAPPAPCPSLRAVRKTDTHCARERGSCGHCAPSVRVATVLEYPSSARGPHVQPGLCGQIEQRTEALDWGSKGGLGCAEGEMHEGNTRDGALESPRDLAPSVPVPVQQKCPLHGQGSWHQEDRVKGRKRAGWWHRPTACAGSVAGTAPPPGFSGHSVWTPVLWGLRGPELKGGVTSSWAGLMMSEKSHRTTSGRDLSLL